MNSAQEFSFTGLVFFPVPTDVCRVNDPWQQTRVKDIEIKEVPAHHCISQNSVYLAQKHL